MENIIEQIFQKQELDGCTVEYYPHIFLNYTTGGTFKNENISELKINNAYITDDNVTEYIHREKKMIIHNNGDREYFNIKQKYNDISKDAGLFIVSKIECIDPNKFPILSQYYDISNKIIKSYDYRYINISLIKENILIDKNQHSEITYIKISFVIPNDISIKKKIIKHIKEVLSSLS
jgi:hypothetical protein